MAMRLLRGGISKTLAETKHLGCDVECRARRRRLAGLGSPRANATAAFIPRDAVPGVEGEVEEDKYRQTHTDRHAHEDKEA